MSTYAKTTEGFALMLEAHLTQALAEVNGVSAEQALQLAAAIRYELAQEFGGLQLYFPKAPLQQGVPQLWHDIWQAAQIATPEAIALKSPVSLRHIYRIIRRMRALDRAQRQGSLLLESEPRS